MSLSATTNSRSTRSFASWRILHPVFRSRGILLAAAVYLVAVLLWAEFGLLGGRFSSPASATLNIANLAAYLGLTSFTLNLLLGARLPFVEWAFGSLDRAYWIHRRIGYSTLVLLTGHVLLVTVSRAINSLAAALALFTPSVSWKIFAGEIAMVILIVVLLSPLIRRMPHQVFVRLHRLVGLVFAISALHVLSIVGLKWSLPASTAYFLALFVVGGAAFLYRSILGHVLVKRYGYQVDQVNRLGATAVELVLAPREESLDFRPGQFVFLTVHDGVVGGEPHPFSVTSSPAEPRLRLMVKALGDYTKRLQDLQAGARAEVEGPYGGFSHLTVKNPRQVWIAGGIGITPFLSMARSLDSDDYEVDLYYCTEHADDAFFLDELFALADQNPRLRVTSIRRDSLGLITAEDIDAASPALGEKDILICGPPRMLHNLQRQFLALGTRPERIHFEDFGALAQ